MNLQANYYVYLIAGITALGGFLFGFDTSVIADIHEQASLQLALSQWQWSKIVSSSVLGCVLGIPLSGLVADKLSRRALLQLVAIGFILGTVLCAQAHSFSMLISGRFLIGVCIGIASYITPLLIAEIAPANQRGRMVLLNGLALTFGQAAAYLIGYLLHDLGPSSWRLILGLGAVPAIILMLGMHYVPHSPRWLFKRFGEEAARKVLEKIRTTPEEIQRELAEMRHCILGGEKNNCSPYAAGRRGRLFKPPMRYVLVVGIVLGLFQQFSGINAILYYGPLIFTQAGFTPYKQALLATFCLSVVNFIMTAMTLISVDRLGRRPMLLSGTGLAGAALLVTSMLFTAHFPGHEYWLLFSFSLYVIGYCMSVGSLFWVVIAEIYPLAVRAQAMSIATVAQWSGNFIVAISFLGIYEYLGPSSTMATFSLLCFLACAFCYWFIPETAGVSLEQIEENLFAGHALRQLGRPLHGEIDHLTREEAS